MGRGSGFPPPPADGTEGTATVTLTLTHSNNQATTRHCINGCLILNNDELKNFLNIKAENHRNAIVFVYFSSFSLPENWMRILERGEITIHRFTKPKRDKVCEVTINPASFVEYFIFKGDRHVFFPGNDKIFKTREFRSFLMSYSKVISLKNNHQIQCSRKYKVLTTTEGEALRKFEEISLTSNNDKLLLRDELFEIVTDGPLLYDNQVVGWCIKSQDNRKIALHKLQTQGKSCPLLY